MTQQHLQNSTKITLLIDLRLPSGDYYYYQNYEQEQFVFGGKEYTYLPIGYSGAGRSLDLENISATVMLPNSPEIRAFVKTNDGLRQANVTMTQFFPDDLNASPIVDRVQVRSSRFNGAQIELTLQSPLGAIVGAGRFPSISFDNKRFPEVPTSGQVQLG